VFLPSLLRVNCELLYFAQGRIESVPYIQIKIEDTQKENLYQNMLITADFYLHCGVYQCAIWAVICRDPLSARIVSLPM